ncbi:MAG: hypothetical protein HQL06_01175 [Nitrospirae bacterium]|nr:hypothetical protein [Nitrospirota bacterium]
MLLEARVDRLEVLMAELIELHRDLKIEISERDRNYKEEQEERDRLYKEKQEERDRLYKEKQEERDRLYKEEQEERDRLYKEEQAERDRLYKEEQAERDRLYKEEQAERDRISEKERNKQRGDIAKQFGILVEDIIQPGTIPLIRKYFKSEPYDIRQRAIKRKGGQNCEVDLLLICEDTVFMIEAKFHPDARDVKDVLAKAETLATFFDECTGKRIIPMLASVVFKDNIIKFASRKGLYVVAYREWEYLDILNLDDINARRECSPSS